MTKMPRTFDVTGLRAAGFEGFETVASLRATRLASVPREPGVYVLVRASRLVPRFLTESTGGWFKGLDPSDPIEALKAKWVKGATVVYIGKAGSENGSATLRRRLTDLLDFGSGKPVGHRGGRFLWHLSDADDFVVCWRRKQRPRDTERQLLARFRQLHGHLPYANLIG